MVEAKSFGYDRKTDRLELINSLDLMTLVFLNRLEASLVEINDLGAIKVKF